MEARAENDVLIINEKKAIQFPYAINNMVIWEDRLVIVCTDTWRLERRDRDIDDNIYAFDEEGRFIWQMEHTGGGGHTEVDILDKELYAFDYGNIRYRLNPSTGEILETIYPTGRPW